MCKIERLNMKIQRINNISDLPIVIITNKKNRETLKRIYENQPPTVKSKNKFERWLAIFKELEKIRQIKKEVYKRTRAPIHIA